ncbi:MAG: DNA primase, partial [Acidimicrobiales bacterium]|nr:DNA primase [Acidimicrobiales bacterium]
MGIMDDDIVKVREATDIVRIISEHVALKRVGRRWSGLCPFHNERSPSFSVNPELGLYHCFGCKESGDAISFVRQTQGLDFVSAVEFLAGKAGITLRYDSKQQGEQSSKKKRAFALVEKALDFYHDRLLSAPDAGPARGYLKSRGYDGDLVRLFKLGWAPDDWDTLAKHLGASDRDLKDAGLGFVNRRGRQQDFHRNRILFPIFDIQGRPIAFGGRKMPDDEGPKYRNTSDECVLYDKSRTLYGLHWAKEDMVRARDNGEAIICEGYTDVHGFHQVGMPRAVATCGTALTEEHVKQLTKFAHRLVLAFDADEAGQSAAERIHQWEQSHGIDVVVANLPEGQDPGDLARSDPDRLREAVEQALPFMQFRLNRVFGAGDFSTPESQARVAQDALLVIRANTNDLVRDKYIMQVADRCGVDPGRLRTMIDDPNLKPSGDDRRRREPAQAAEKPRRRRRGPVRSEDRDTNAIRLLIAEHDRMAPLLAPV